MKSTKNIKEGDLEIILIMKANVMRHHCIISERTGIV